MAAVRRYLRFAIVEVGPTTVVTRHFATREYAASDHSMITDIRYGTAAEFEWRARLHSSPLRVARREDKGKPAAAFEAMDHWFRVAIRSQPTRRPHSTIRLRDGRLQTLTLREAYARRVDEKNAQCRGRTPDEGLSITLAVICRDGGGVEAMVEGQSAVRPVGGGARMICRSRSTIAEGEMNSVRPRHQHRHQRRYGVARESYNEGRHAHTPSPYRCRD